MAAINKPSQPLVPAEIDPVVLDSKADLVNGEVPSTQLPSYVDDVLEFTNSAAFPKEGESGKIYVALDTNFTYRWGDTAYIQVGGGSTDNDVEIVEYQDQTPITEAQLAKAVAGKLAIHCNGRLYAKYYQSDAIINFHSFDIGHNMSSSVTVTSTMQSKEWVILLNRSTRMLSNSGYMPVSAVGDYADNFLATGTTPAVDGKKLIREANLAEGLSTKQNSLVSGTNIKTINGQSVLGSGDLEIGLSQSAETEVQSMIDAAIGDVLNKGF